MKDKIYFSEFPQYLSDAIICFIYNSLQYFHIYPDQAFERTRFLSGFVFTSKVPSLREYVSEIGLSLKSLIQYEIIDRFCIVFHRDGNYNPLFELEFNSFPQSNRNVEGVDAVTFKNGIIRLLSCISHLPLISNEQRDLMWYPKVILKDLPSKHQNNREARAIFDESSLFWIPPTSLGGPIPSMPVIEDKHGIVYATAIQGFDNDGRPSSILKLNVKMNRDE